MSFEGDLGNLSLGDVFQNIQSNGLSGTLRLESPSETAYLYFSEGGLAAVSAGEAEARTSLAGILRKQRIVDAAVLERQIKIRARRELRTMLADKGLASLDEQRSAVEFYVRETVYEIFSWLETRFRFEDGKPDSRLFDRELIRLKIVIPLTGLLMEAARRQDDWARLRRVVPSFKEHYLALSEGSEELSELDREVLKLLDGTKDLDAVAAALPYGRFALAESICNLLAVRDIRPVGAEDLRRQAEALEAQGKLAPAAELLVRSLEIERGSLEGRSRLAELLEQLDRYEQAADQWKMLAFIQLDRHDARGAQESYRRAVAAAPDDLPLRRKQLDLLLSEGPIEQALEAGKRLAAAALRQDLYTQAVAVYEELLGLGKERTELQKLLAEAHLARQDLEAALAVYRSAAQEGMKSGELGTSLLFYRKILKLSEDDVEAAKQVYEIESGLIEKRRARRQKLLSRFLLLLFVTPVLLQATREFLAARALSATYPSVVAALSSDQGEHMEQAATALAAVRESWPYTLSGWQLDALNEALVAEETGSVPGQLQVSADDVHEARRRLRALLVLSQGNAERTASLEAALARLPEESTRPGPAENPQSPRIEQLSASATAVAWPGEVELHAVARGGPLAYHWSCTAGRLKNTVTSVPRNTWSAPYQGDPVEISLVVHDAAGLESQAKTLRIQPTGEPDGFMPRFYPFVRQLGDHKAVFSKIADIAFDAEGQGYVLDSEARTLTLVDNAWKPLMTYGPYSENYDFFRLQMRAEDGQMFAYLLDRYSKAAYRFPLSAQGSFSQVPQQLGKAGDDGVNGELVDPIDLALNGSGELYILDRRTGSVQLFGVDGSFLLSVGSKVYGARENQLEEPVAIAVDPQGRLAVLDNGRKKKLVLFESHRPALEVVVGDARETMVDVDFDPRTGRVFVLADTAGDPDLQPIKTLLAAGNAVISQFASQAAGGASFEDLREVSRIRVSPSGEVFVISRSDRGVGEELFRYLPTGNTSWRFYGKWGGENEALAYATKITADLDGYVGVLAPEIPAVLVLSPDGWLTAKFGHTGPKDALLETPVDIASDARGNFYVLDRGKGNIRKFQRNGTFAGEIGVGGGGEEELSDHLDLYAADDGELAVLMYRNYTPLMHFDAQGAQLSAFPTARDLDINYPVSVGLFSGGDLLVGCDNPIHIKRYTRRGAHFFAENLYEPVSDLTTYGDLGTFVNGLSVFCDPSEHKVGVLNQRLQSLAPLTDGMATHCPSPIDVGTDGWGNILVLDGDNARIAVFSLYR